jgi:hypothetical protein
MSKPAPPKKPLTAYFLYKEDVYDAVKKAHPDVKPSKIMKIIGTQYSKLSEAEQKTYNDRAEKLKEQYNKEKKDFEAKHGPIPVKKKASTTPKTTTASDRKTRAAKRAEGK